MAPSVAVEAAAAAVALLRWFDVGDDDGGHAPLAVGTDPIQKACFASLTGVVEVAGPSRAVSRVSLPFLLPQLVSTSTAVLVAAGFPLAAREEQAWAEQWAVWSGVC